MAKKRWEVIDLFGNRFEFDTKETTGYRVMSYRGLEDCYGRCSEAKKHIWRSWESWFNANNGWCRVSSYNSNIFTIEGYVRNYETREMWYCYITPAHNRCWKVEEELV